MSHIDNRNLFSIPVSRPHFLVTGATGFIGKPLCQTLMSESFRVRVLVRTLPESSCPWHEAIQCDLNNEYVDNPIPDAALMGIDTVIHLAGIAHATRHNAIAAEKYYRVNCEATEKLLRLSAKQGVRRFIYFSSVKAANLPSCPYSHSKYQAEQLVLSLGKQLGLHVAILRPALVYGPNVKGNLFGMIRAIDKGWFPPLPEVENHRSMVSVYDVINAVLMCTFNPIANGKIYTVSDHKTYSTRQIYDAIREALYLKPASWCIPKWLLKMPAYFSSGYKEKLEKLFGSEIHFSELIKEELGWIPTKDFYTVLPEMISVYKQNQSR